MNWDLNLKQNNMGATRANNAQPSTFLRAMMAYGT